MVRPSAACVASVRRHRVGSIDRHPRHASIADAAERYSRDYHTAGSRPRNGAALLHHLRRRTRSNLSRRIRSQGAPSSKPDIVRNRLDCRRSFLPSGGAVPIAALLRNGIARMRHCLRWIICGRHPLSSASSGIVVWCAAVGNSLVDHVGGSLHRAPSLIRAGWVTLEN